MSDLFGAWSLSGKPLKLQFHEAHRQAVLAQLPGFPGNVNEFRGDFAWIVAGKGKLAETGDACLAMEGHLLFGESAPKDLLDLLPNRTREKCGPGTPEGDYVLAHADLPRQTLTLTRSLSGGEKLYYARINDLVLFASSVRPLLITHRPFRDIDIRKVGEALLTGLTLFGGGTLFEGIAEVLPGQSLTFEGEAQTQRWELAELLQPMQGDPAQLAREYRTSLGEAVALSIGSERRVAVTLSGGIDSSAVTALAVEAVGAENVDVFTYEFDDPTHASETYFAAAVCRRLGIRRHHIFKVTLADFLAAIPETVWRAEHFVHWPKAWMLPVTRHIRDAGFPKYLSGFGIGSHMGFFEDIAHLLKWLPIPRLLPFYWKLAHTRRWRWLKHLEIIHPGLAPPNWRLHYLLLCVLQEHGMLRNVAALYPARMQALVRHGLEFAALDSDPHGFPLIESLRMQSFSHLISCMDVTRWGKPFRELGTQRTSPAHFSRCLPFGFMPIQPQPFVWSKARRLRPGKLLLRLAMGGTLPDEVLFRKKSWEDAVISPDWQKAGVKWMQSVLPRSTDYLGLCDKEQLSAIRYWDSRSPQASVIALAFFHKIFIATDTAPHPPTWEQLRESSGTPQSP